MRRLLITTAMLLITLPAISAENVPEPEISIDIKSVEILAPTITDTFIDQFETAINFVYPEYRTAEEEKVFKREQECLAKNIYFESYREPYEGRLAVAQVTKNRVEDPAYPKSYCDVVWQQNKNRRTGRRVAQFSWTLDGRSDIPHNIKAYAEALDLAENVLLYGVTSDIINANVLFYHATSVSPRWHGVTRVTQIGNHIFYAPRI